MNRYELRHITHCYNGHPVLSLDFWQVSADAIVGLAGPNGSGKSTLLQLLGFVRKPTAGQICFDGHPIHRFSSNLRAQVALLPQEPYLLKRPVYENIAYGLRIRGDRPNERRRIHEALTQVGLAPQAFTQRQWHELSGGEARRVALAARLVLKPRVLLLDEPTASVDAASIHLIKEAALQARRQWGATVIIASHDLEWLQDVCDDIHHLFRGRLLGQGRQTLIFGPWQPHPKGLAKQLSAEQHFITAQAPQDLTTAVAAVDPLQITLYRAPDHIPRRQQILQGTILRLSLEKNTGHINAAIAVGNTIFTAYLSAETAACSYSPGQTVWMGYDPQTITWY